MTAFPPAATDKAGLEEGAVFTPRFDANGLVTAITGNAATGEGLMLAPINAEALRLTPDTRHGPTTQLLQSP